MSGGIRQVRLCARVVFYVMPARMKINRHSAKPSFRFGCRLIHSSSPAGSTPERRIGQARSKLETRGGDEPALNCTSSVVRSCEVASWIYSSAMCFYLVRS